MVEVEYLEDEDNSDFKQCRYGIADETIKQDGRSYRNEYLKAPETRMMTNFYQVILTPSR